MDRYEKIRVIGQGAFGKVFLCKRITDNNHVVIKQIPVDELLADERKSAMNEVDVLSMLKHPNIIAYYTSFLEEKSLMIAMEYAPGGTLYELVQERNGELLEEETVLQLFVQILVAIEHVHYLNILHRDLKPQNIMLNKKRTVVKIGDFGIAKVLSSKITSAQTVVGTPCYISPEICEGRVYRKKSDIWSLGCILYELLALKKAFEGPNLPALVLKIMQGANGIQVLSERYSQGLRSLVNAMLQRNPDDRPNIENIMANPVMVNAHINLGTDVGRLPCSQPAKSAGKKHRSRHGFPGNFRQVSFFENYYHPPTTKDEVQSRSKPVVYLWGGSLCVPMILPQPPEAPVTDVSMGRSHRAAITEDGKLIFWELTSGSLTSTHLTLSSHTKAKDPIVFQPQLVEGFSSVYIKKVSCGDLFTACLTDKGILMTFGSGVNGCLGHGNYDDVAKAKLVGAMLQYETVDMSCGANHMITITADNKVHSWGRNESGQLGTGDTRTYNEPKQVMLPAAVTGISSLDCGTDCSILVTDSGNVYVAGSNRCNKLGLDHASQGEGPIGLMSMSKQVMDLQSSLVMSSIFRSSSAHQSHDIDQSDSPSAPNTCHIDKVLSFTISSSHLLRDSITDVAIGTNHCAFINKQKQCITSGSNTYGQLGHSSTEGVPAVISQLSSVEHVACGDMFTIATTTGGGVYSWGCGRRGRLGFEFDGQKSEPTPLSFESSQTIKSVQSNRSVTMLIAIPID